MEYPHGPAGPGAPQTTPQGDSDAPPNVTASLTVTLADATIAPGTTVTPPPSTEPPAGAVTTPTPPGDNDAPPNATASLTVTPADATIMPGTTVTPPSSTEPPAGAITSPATTPLTGMYTCPPPRPEIVKRGKEKKARRKVGEPAGKRGRVSWIWGTKLKFFESRKDEWLTAHEQKVAGAFYTKMAKLYIIKYGCHLAADDDFAYDVADPPDWVANKVVNERLSPEETEFRQEYHTILRDRLGEWYRRQFASLLKEDKATFADIFGHLGEGGRKPPRRPQLLHFYSEKRYDEHIKPRVEARKKVLAVRAEMTGVKAPAAITIQNEVTKECWDEESDLYMDSLLREREREHEIRLRAWRESTSDGPNRTPEEFSASLKSAAHYLQPFVDIISERFGMCVSILMAGPIGEHGGRIEMRSVHAGKTRGLVEKDWPLQDPDGFTRVQRSMVEFAHHVFSRAECESRVTEVQELIPDAAGGGVSASAGQGGINSAGEGHVPANASQPAPISEGGASNVGQGEGGGDGMDQGEENEDTTVEGHQGEQNEDTTVEGQVEKLWQRRDAGGWTEELKRAHAAFSRGKAWGIEWASLVNKYYDFEAAWGHRDAGGQITTESRPKALEWWISRGRKWEKTVDIGVVGNAKAPGTFVSGWWNWWVNVQPAESGDWPTMLKLHGKNGLLQLMASLLWWGERVADGNPADVREWSTAVEDVGDVFTQLLRPGLIAKLKTTETRGKEAPKGKKRKSAGTDEIQVEGRRATRYAD
ncbi:hypothetical protein B0H14DRAFT_3452103 [Mycena olivaceomarginata]|nr:hypothetical protein B0H14DRAFT_3452103 [Mycena olivaceomarginata]